MSLLRLLSPLLLLLGSVFVTPAQADALNKTLLGGLAIDGYDAVAYHLEQRAVKGRREFRHAWNGATWQFTSADHLQRFKSDPARYAPQYGGYCAYAVAAKNELVDIDPEAFTLVDGKLYLNYSPAIRTQWEAQRAQYIRQGDRHWPALRDRP